MANVLHRLFVQHPREVEETYLEHAGAASRYGWRLLKASLAAYTHALIPGLCKTAASDCVREMAGELNGRAVTAREERMRQAGVWDPGL
ncbi:DUF6356 family protein [Caulobacter sp. 17J65-9]|uniref:DUF6356 family protein n=1 Tax=Caulobacter sp. 17J65-9 TaxID=2709382 RepID=UPI0013CC7A7F|nr:DUF6356 family protein [Caulobacter sp. 17J65-9]NEX94149.1 hypothetical protein [Caulobacter sp. 17J65-9]